jgi:hypothetical protein
MRDPGFRPEIKNLYILGAGASYSASLKANKNAPSITPLDNNFCQRIHDLDYVRPNWIGKVVRRTKSIRDCGVEVLINSEGKQVE